MFISIGWKRVLASGAVLLVFTLANGCDTQSGNSQHLKSILESQGGTGRYRLSTADLKLFYDSAESKLPLYEDLFKNAAKDHHLPWRLVAAVSFQESHWDLEARSHTGVRGLMQLTEDAAEHMGIADRKDPEQNVWGGTKYLRFLFRAQPHNLSFREKLQLALAAYNIGLGHLQDAQKLAVRFGKNPFDWKELRKVLPLISSERWSKDLEYGSARGIEAVQFSERTLAYYDLLLHSH